MLIRSHRDVSCRDQEFFLRSILSSEGAAGALGPSQSALKRGGSRHQPRGARKVWRRLYWSGSLNDRAKTPRTPIGTITGQFFTDEGSLSVTKCG
jgi:hypothetical protein